MRAPLTPVVRRAASISMIVGLALAGSAGAQESIRVAYGDIASVEALNLLIALEAVKERGVEVEFIEFNAEDIANQAVINGQADIGVGTPYAIVQRVDVPVRAFFQLGALRFFPVVDKASYPDWQALDDGPFAVHTRGSGTEAMAKLIEQVEGITFGEISYVPGSDVRTLALLRGNVTATFLDIAGRNLVLEQAPDRFHVLPIRDVNASDETLFARLDWIEANPQTVDVLVEELLTTWREINRDPGFVARERERLGLLPDLPDDLAAEIDPYFRQSVASQTFPDDGGRSGAAESDIRFYTVSGQLRGDPATLKPEDFWTFAPLERALAKTGG